MQINFSKPDFLFIGDSHVRSFIDQGFCFFVGPGKDNNFLSDASAKALEKKISNILVCLKKNTEIIFIFGEPDCRFALGKGWHPWLSSATEVTNFDIVRASAIRCVKCILAIKKKFNSQNISFFSPAFGQRIQQNKLIEAWIGVFLKNCSEKVLCYDANQFMTPPFEKYYADPVHLSRDFVNKIMKKKALTSLHERNLDSLFNKKIHKIANFNLQFKCFSLLNTT